MGYQQTIEYRLSLIRIELFDEAASNSVEDNDQECCDRPRLDTEKMTLNLITLDCCLGQKISIEIMEFKKECGCIIMRESLKIEI